MYNRKQLENALTSAGLRRDDKVVIHSSASSVGAVEGGVEGLLQVFIDFFADGGLCVFPTMTYTLFHAWDPNSGWCSSCPVPQKYCFAHGLARSDVRQFRENMPACTGARPVVCSLSAERCLKSLLNWSGKTPLTSEKR